MGLVEQLTDIKTRLNTVLEESKTALTDKGVEVPEDMTLGGLAALVESIEAGGGNFASGTFTTSSILLTVELEHNLGVVPNVYLVYAKDATYDANYYIVISIATYTPIIEDYTSYTASLSYYEKNGGINSSTPFSSGVLVTEDPNTTNEIQKTPFVRDANTETCKIHGIYYSNVHRCFQAGTEYSWIIGRV